MTNRLPRATTRPLKLYAWPMGAAVLVGGIALVMFVPPPGAEPAPRLGTGEAASQTTAATDTADGTLAQPSPSTTIANATQRASDSVATFGVPG